MKKMKRLLSLVVIAAMSFTACQSGFDEPTVNYEEVLISFVASPEATRTSVDTTGETPIFSWDANENFEVLEQTDVLAKATSVSYTKDDDGKANITASFIANAKGAYQYVTVYPKSGYVSATDINTATLTLPANQTMVADSYDPAADLMVSKVVSATVQPTEAQQVQFTRLAAVVKMTLKNLNLEVGDAVEKVIFTADGKNIAGQINTDLTDPHAFSVSEGSSSVNVATTAEDYIYFTLLPETLNAGDTYSITVITTNRVYVKTGAIGEGKSLQFQAGMVTCFGVNMEGVVAGKKWVLVRDASTLAQGDIVTIAAQNNNYVLGCNSANNYPYASYNTDIVKVGDYLYHPIVTDKSKYQYMIQPLILSKQDAGKAAFDFYNDVDYDGDTKTGYLTSVETNNWLKLSSYPSIDSAFEITIENGVAKIEATQTQWKNNLLKFYNYNPNSTTSTYRRFVCIDETKIDAAKHDDVCIYKLEGEKGEVPVADAVVTVPGVNESVVIPVEGVAEETIFEDVKFTYVGDWTIEATSDAPWLTVSYKNGALYYLASANAGITRKATVTIRATYEGETEKSWTVSVVQKGTPIKATIAEFITKDVDVNTEYEVTGILKTKATHESAGSVITDANGNEATFKYIYMENDAEAAFIDNDDIKVGDVVTIIAAVAEEKIGGSSSAHAICKGYYNLSAVADKDLVAYTGDSVEVTLNKLGTLEPVGNINYSVDALFAEVAYTTNATNATITLPANEGAPRQVVVTFTDGFASASVTIVQSADTTKGNTWELVTDASTLEAGDQVIIAAKDYDAAMSTTISSSRRDAVAVTKLGSYYLTPAASVQTLVLVNGSATGTFAFYDAVNEGYLLSDNKTSYYLKNQAYIDANTSFAISIADGVATIGNSEGNFNANKIYYREANNYFYSGTYVKESVCLYRLVGVKGTIPVAEANATMPSELVVIPEEGSAVAKPINEVVFNYVGDWTIEAQSNDSWVNVAYDDVNNCLTYTADVNNDIGRQTEITVTATREGTTLNLGEFSIFQKGAPQEVSIAEFKTKDANVDVVYKLTGVVTTVPSSSYNPYVLSDGNGNTANIKYLRDEDGDDISIKEGDVITVTTVVTSSTKGQGGSSSYPSYLKGYYRLTATVGLAADYKGGSVDIDVATSSDGLITLPDAITATIEPNNSYAELSYSGGNTATVNFATENTTTEAREAVVTFTYGLTSVSVTAEQGVDPSKRVGWNLVANAATLTVGDQIVIAAKGADKAMALPTSTITSASNFSAVEVDKSGNVVYDVEKAGAVVFTIVEGNSDGTFALQFTSGETNYYLYTSSSSSSSTLRGNTSNSNYTSFTIETDPESGDAIIKNKSYSKVVKFNSATGTTFFAPEASKTNATKAENAVVIYKK
ncbi:MAG: BACON domain-containing protein [Alistipes sp.]|nr:BACON domain-containing protein [Alistipes sp.]